MVTCCIFGLLSVGVGAEEVGEGPLAPHQLRVGAGLCDLPVHHHQDHVKLGQETQAMGHQHTCLRDDAEDGVSVSECYSECVCECVCVCV